MEGGSWDEWGCACDGGACCDVVMPWGRRAVNKEHQNYSTENSIF